MSYRATHSSMFRAGSILVIRPSIQTSYDCLKRWLEAHDERVSVAVLGQASAEQLARVLAPRVVYAVPRLGRLLESGAMPGRWWKVSLILNRYETVAVLCVGDGEVTTGYSAYRVLGELLFSDRVVLIGPTVTQAWPGGRGLFKPKRAREMATLALAVGIGVSTAAAVLAAIMAQEALSRSGLLR